MKNQPETSRAPERARPKREGVEQVLPDDQAGLEREPLRDEATMAEPQRRGTGETGEDEDLPDGADTQRRGSRRATEP